ncbi:MAG: phytanoyl-CoA dioxygenase family protein [Alphaproteobacteria bacterium]|nr:phytanoyl-CoA dioxygenase family protein [Alphaproteobacteria bacterium]MBL6940288.1 phytanoyl-CoA dioxygenase family protein [Alphaproteobacteria bacterium]MBL7099731.1 phytanoyl-CoA dioxygenase family protein [Alphaproteobacteria bacterium]
MSAERRSLETLPPRDWPTAARTLEDDGVVFLKSALGPTDLALIEQEFAHSVAHPTPKAVNFYPSENATFFEDTGQRMLPMVRATGIDAMVAALFGEPDLWYMGEQLFLKENGFSRRTPWHQDTSYLRMMGSQLVACWVTLDPLPREHCLEFVRGSHKGTLYNGSAFAAHDDTAPLYKDSKLPRLPDIQKHRADFDILAWDMEPGDLIVFHLGMLHGGAGTVPGMRRRTVSLRFMGPNVVFDGRPRDNVGAQEGNDAALAAVYGALKHGDPLSRVMGQKI